MQHIEADAESRGVLVVDTRALRGAILAGFLSDWGKANQVFVSSVPPTALRSLAGSATCFALAILSIGGASVGAPTPLKWLGLLRTHLPGTPVAIVSDCDAGGEAMATFHAGAQGLVPLSTEPDIVLRAFSCIMAGGYFFPLSPISKRPGVSETLGPSTASVHHDGEPKLVRLPIGKERQLPVHHLLHT